MPHTTKSAKTLSNSVPLPCFSVPAERPRVLRLPAVLGRVGMSRSWIYESIKQDAFPSPIYLGPKSVGWLDHEIDHWLEERIAKCRRPGAKQ